MRLILHVFFDAAEVLRFCVAQWQRIGLHSLSSVSLDVFLTHIFNLVCQGSSILRAACLGHMQSSDLGLVGESGSPGSLGINDLTTLHDSDIESSRGVSQATAISGFVSQQSNEDDLSISGQEVSEVQPLRVFANESNETNDGLTDDLISEWWQQEVGRLDKYK